jgi:anti-sigma regulatory factor (Ser/Thr protein kinase)
MGQGPSSVYRRRFVAGPEACYDARRALERFTDELGVELVRRMQLLVSELVGNAVSHAGTGRRGLVDLEVLLTRERVRVTVADHGGGFERAAPPTDTGRHRTRGLEIVQGMSDRWGVATDGKTRVWFEIDRQ